MMTDIRCVKCNRLLMKAVTVNGEIKCGKCGFINKVQVYFSKRQKPNEMNKEVCKNN